MSNYFEEYAQMSKIKLVSMIVDLQTDKGISDYWNDLMEGHSTKFLIQGKEPQGRDINAFSAIIDAELAKLKK